MQNKHKAAGKEALVIKKQKAMQARQKESAMLQKGAKRRKKK